MSRTVFVPPVKCQGIKTKLVPEIRLLAAAQEFDCWIEPFCGSCVVPLNLQPKRALLCDTNVHIVRLYSEIQHGTVTPSIAREFLENEGEELRNRGETHYYDVRRRFNEGPNSLDFLFLNRSCFNGVIRFNKSGKFNVPFGHKPERFAKAYVTKISNQIRRIAEVSRNHDWEFRAARFEDTIATASPDDFIYCDPPYLGRHTDYFNQWCEDDERRLSEMLQRTPARFVLSTWHSNRYRKNPTIESRWQNPRFQMATRDHFYHVGATEDLRNEMLEALIMNFPLPTGQVEPSRFEQVSLF